jgi:hypothetical protein
MDRLHLRLISEGTFQTSRPRCRSLHPAMQFLPEGNASPKVGGIISHAFLRGHEATKNFVKFCLVFRSPICDILSSFFQGLLTLPAESA